MMPQAELQLSAENETGELMSSGGAKDAFVLIPAPWEQSQKGERAWARAGQLGPHSRAWPAGQPPAGASRQACGCHGQPAHPPPALLPLASGRERRGHPVAWSRGANVVTVVCSPGWKISPVASMSSGSDDRLHL